MATEKERVTGERTRKEKKKLDERWRKRRNNGPNFIHQPVL